MSDISPRADPEASAADRAAELLVTIHLIDLQIRIMKAELVEIQIRMFEDDQSAVRDGAKLMSDIRYWLKQAHDVEIELETSRKDSSGDTHGTAINFDEARSEMRCRLDRLRDCRDPESLS